MISNRQLQYALAVQKTRHFRKAAELCAVSQAALSISIADLERHLGFLIFERDNKKVLMTHLGEIFLEKAAEVSLQFSELEKFSRTTKAPLTLPMKIGMIPTICPFLLPILLPQLYQQYPDFELIVVEETSLVLIEKVKTGEIDVAILALPFDVQGLLSFPFWQENFYFVTHQERHKKKMTHISYEQFKDETLLLLKEGHCFKDHVLQVCKMPVLETKYLLSSTSLHTLVELVVCKMGATFLPEMALSSLLSRHKNLLAIPLKERGPHREWAFILRPTFPHFTEIELLKSFMVKCLSQHLS